MVFKKGNTLWKEGVKVRKEKNHKLDQFMYILATGGVEKYADILDKLSQGIKLTKPEKEFLDRVEGWREFLIPKLARQELTGKGGEELFPKPIMDVPKDNSHKKDSGDEKKN